MPSPDSPLEIHLSPIDATVPWATMAGWAAMGRSAATPRSVAMALAIGSALLLTSPALVAQDLVPFERGMVVEESVRIEPGTYRVPAAASLEEALIVVSGDDVVLDLTGVRFVGLPVEDDPDQARGVAIRVDGGRDVTVLRGAIRGYRFGILARGTRALRVVETDLSYGWKPRLFSQVGQESLVDWLSYHANEDREWMRFGAALYLEDVRGGAITGIRAVQGMNGLLMTRSDSLLIRGNDFSYNSGLGIGLYRSSWNRVVDNRLDYDVRGYSDGMYQRGQDSAGLLVYEQSSHNVVAYNSATHSGDGFFLWAGQSTMDSGDGGANENLVFYNDFSFAPTNAVEVTFSRNRIVGNYLRGSRYGVWGGYSWHSEVRGNCFAGNRHGVAIEHGQDNRIADNRFDADSLAISLWSREAEPADWGYAQVRDTYSRGHVVEGNTFARVREVWRLERTRENRIGANLVLHAVPPEPCDPRRLLGSDFDALASEVPEAEPVIPTSPRARLPRSAIVVDEWGPFDGRSPKLWPVDTTRAVVALRTLGPPGGWRLLDAAGTASVTPRRGVIGDTVVVRPAAGSPGEWSVRLEYVGDETVSPRGVVRPAGEPVDFGYEWFEPIREWTVRYFTWEDPELDPDGGDSDRLFKGAPLRTERRSRLDHQWFSSRLDFLPQTRWALDATTEVTLSPGEYSLRAISDGSLRIWIDGRLVIDRWEPHNAAVDYAAVAAGTHTVRVQYAQIEGWTEIRAEIVRGSNRSSGSPGPH